MEQSQSKRHHYVPEFYLKSFTTDEGYFYVFDKQTEKIRLAYPKEYFYGWNRNTGTIGDETSTLLESMYGYFESSIAPHYEGLKIATNLTDINLTSFFSGVAICSLLILANT